MLKLLMAKGPSTWRELWKEAKKQGLHYQTFKKHMKMLAKDKIVSVEIKSEELPAEVRYTFDRERLKLEIIFIETVVSFVNNGIKKRNIQLENSGSMLITETQKELTHLFKICTDPKINFKTYLEWTGLSSRIGLFLSKRWEKTILEKFSVDERKTILEYKETLFQYLNIHFKQDLLTDMKDSKDVELAKIIYRPTDFDHAEEILNILRNERLWKERLRERFPTKQRQEKEHLERFLRNHGALYDTFREELNKEPRIVAIIPSSGFYHDYAKEKNRMLIEIPPELWLEYEYERGRISQEHLEILAKSAFSSLEWAGKHKIVFVCKECGEAFRRKGGCKRHITRNHGIAKEPKLSERILKLPTSYYIKLMSIILAIKGKTE